MFQQVSKRPLPLVVAPTVAGVEHIASRLLDGDIVALPTECTYEVVTHLNCQEPSAWAGRIQLLQQHSAVSETNDSQPSCRSTSFSNLNNSLSDSSESTDASPDVRDPLRRHSEAVVSAVPHIYVPQAVLDGPFWRKCLPKRPYAIRNKEGDVLAAHAFNETQQVLSLLAAKLWPGPVMIFVPVALELPRDLIVSRNGKSYVALRSLCHPLMARVYEEYLASSIRSNKEGVEDSDVSGGFASSPIRVCSTQATSRNPGTLMIGVAMENHTEDEACYITKAGQVLRSDLTVLNGEESPDMFAVPPCEYRQPCSDGIWLDLQRRTVVLQSMDNRSNREHVTANALLQALHNTRRVAKTDYDRVIQAVVSKWKVEEEVVAESRRDEDKEEN